MLRTLVMLLMLASFPAAAGTPARAQIEQVFATWKEGYNSKDITKAMSIYTDDLKYSYQGQPDVDLAGLRAQYVADFENAHPAWTWTSSTEEVHSDGKIAVAISRWALRTGSANDAGVLIKIRSIDMLRKTNKGWKIFRTVSYPD